MSQNEAGLVFSLPLSTGAHDGGVSSPLEMWDTCVAPRAQAARRGLGFDTVFSSVGQRRVLGLRTQTLGGKSNGQKWSDSLRERGEQSSPCPQISWLLGHWSDRHVLLGPKCLWV